MARALRIDTRGKKIEAVVEEIRAICPDVILSRITYPCVGHVMWLGVKTPVFVLIDEIGDEMVVIAGYDVLRTRDGVWGIMTPPDKKCLG